MQPARTLCMSTLVCVPCVCPPCVSGVWWGGQVSVCVAPNLVLSSSQDLTGSVVQSPPARALPGPQGPPGPAGPPGKDGAPGRDGEPVSTHFSLAPRGWGFRQEGERVQLIRQSSGPWGTWRPQDGRHCVGHCPPCGRAGGVREAAGRATEDEGGPTLGGRCLMLCHGRQVCGGVQPGSDSTPGGVGPEPESPSLTSSLSCSRATLGRTEDP